MTLWSRYPDLRHLAFQALNLQSSVISLQTAGLEERESPFLSCLKPKYLRHNFQESHSPLFTHPRVFISHPERRVRRRLFVLTIFQISSPINARDVRSPPCTSPQVQTHLRGPPSSTSKALPPPDLARTHYPAPSAIAPAAHRAWSSGSFPFGLAAARRPRWPAAPRQRPPPSP